MQKLLSVPFYRRLLLLAILLHLSAAWFSEGYYKDDEHHQILEFSAVKTGELPTEQAAMGYAERWRSAFQPAIAYLFWQVVPDNINAPFMAAFLARLLSVVLAFAAALVFFNAYQNDLRNENTRRWMLSAMLLCWTLLFYHARFSSEGWMVSFLLLAFAFLRTERFLTAGLCFGLAFVVRYQTGFILLPLAAYIIFILRPAPKPFLLLVVGGVVALLVEFFINWWFYGAPTLPWINYFLLHTTGETGNSESVFMYWRKGGEFVPPVGYILPLMLAVFWWKFPRHILTWAMALYVVFHLFSENRQLRFMLPVLAFMPLMIAMIWEKFIQHKGAIQRGFLWLLKISVVINAPLLLFAAFYPATVEVKLLRQCILPTMQKDNLTAYNKYGEGTDTWETVALPFYIRQMPIEQVSNESELAGKLTAGQPALYISRKPRNEQLQENGLEFQRVCSALPEWVLRLNFNNWTARASSYPVYQVVKL